MWITIKKVPHSMFSWKGLGFLASVVGEPKWLHPETEICKSFEEAKVFVEVNLMKELPKTFKFEIEPGKDEGEEFFYPWLPPKCGTYSRWGHFQEGCKVSPPTISILKCNDKPGKSQPSTDKQHESPKFTTKMTSATEDAVEPTTPISEAVVLQQNMMSKNWGNQRRIGLQYRLIRQADRKYKAFNLHFVSHPQDTLFLRLWAQRMLVANVIEQEEN